MDSFAMGLTKKITPWVGILVFPPKFAWIDHEMVTGNKNQNAHEWLPFFAVMVFVNLVTIFKVYCNITIIKGKGRKTLGYDFFSALDEIKGHHYIFSCFNVFFPIIFFSPLKKQNKVINVRDLERKNSWTWVAQAGSAAVPVLCPVCVRSGEMALSY